MAGWGGVGWLVRLVQVGWLVGRLVGWLVSPIHVSQVETLVHCRKYSVKTIFLYILNIAELLKNLYSNLQCSGAVH